MPRVSSRKPTRSRNKPSWLIPGIIVLVLLVVGGGALFLATRSAFTYGGFADYQSADGLVQFEYPDSWKVQPNASLEHAYAVQTGDGHSGGLKVVLMPTTNLLTLLEANQLASTVTPNALLKQVFASKPAELNTLKPVQIGTFSGAGVHYTDRRTNLATNQDLSQDVDFWVVSLDQTHVATVTGIADSGSWSQMQPIFDHFIRTLKIDALAAIKVVDAAPTAAVPTILAGTPSAASTVSP